METAARLQQNDKLIPLHPDKPETWRNVACPDGLTPIQKELTRVGGKNEFGEPNFIIVWGQEYRTFDCGRMRIHFSEDAVPAVHQPNRWAVTPEVYARAVAWYKAEEQKRRDAFMRCDWEGVNRFPDLALYLSHHELSGNYKKLPSEESDFKTVVGLMPSTWIYIQGLHTFEHIGEQCYYVIQWFTPREFGKHGKKSWKALRYDKHYYPETDRVEPMLDVLGPFPEKGQYEHVAYRICEEVEIVTRHAILIGEERRVLMNRYKQPTLDNVIPPLQELLRIREEAANDQIDPVKRNANRFKDFRRRRVESDGKWRKDFRQMFNDAKPVGKGNPTNISANKTKFDQ